MDYYVLGIIAGIAVAVGIAVITYLIVRNRTGGRKYDERQLIGQGKAHRAGFFTLLIAQALVSALLHAELLPGTALLWHCGAMLLGVGVYALTAIYYDAYLGMTDTPKRFTIMGACFAVAMLCGAVGNLSAERESGRVLAWLDLMLAALWLVILAALWLHGRKQEAEE